MTRSRDLANLADSTEFTSADHAKLDGIEASATADQTNAQIKTAVEAGADISLGGNPTTTTQSAGNNTTRVATTAFTQAAITALVGSVPATLNTLAELGDALGDDPNYATTTSNLIGTKMPLAGGAFTGAVTTNSTIDGVDIATRDGVLTNTTNTANAALPKAGGALTGVLTTNSSVGIGTSSPGSWSNAQNQLVVGDGSGDSGITIYSQNNANSNLRFSDGTTGSQQYSGRIEYDHVNDNLYLGAGGITPFIITTAGNVGIGIETPTSKLHVDGDLLSTGEIIALSSTVDFSTTSSARDSNWIASFTNSGTTNPYGLYVDTTGAASTGYNLACYTNTGTGLFVKNDGNVGIGTTTPNAVAGYATLTLDGTSGSLLDFEVAGAITGELYATAATGMGMQAVGSRHIQFKTNNEERMRITNTGSVIMTSTGWDGALDNSDTNVVGHNFIADGRHYLQVDANTTNYEVILVNNILASDAVAGVLQYRARGNIKGSLNGSGSGLAIVNASDYRKKENITDLSGSLAKIKALRPVTFTHRSAYTTDTSAVKTGMIAHEVAAVLPNLVVGEKDAVDDDGEIVLQALSYSGDEMITHLIGAIKELEARITEIEG